MKDKEFTKEQHEAIELIKNKKGSKNMKAPKEVKTFTLKQIIRAIIITLALLGLGAFAGITIEKAIAGTINSQVKEQVRSFTEAVETQK